MYLEYYGLKECPFSLTPDPRYIFKTESHLEVLATVKYGVEQNKGLIVVSGEVGCGKTTILRAALSTFGDEVLAVYIFNPFLTAGEFFEQLAAEMDLRLPRTVSKPEMLAVMARMLAERHAAGLRTVLIVDEAHGLPTALLEEIRLLMNFETNSEKLLQVVLCGQPELAETLNRPQLRQLKQRVSLRCSIKPLSVFEISKYIRFRLKQAGAANVGLFDNAAVKLIGQVSQGIPRIINNICDNALLYGYAANSEVITREIVEEVVRALDLAPPAASENNVIDFGNEFSSGR
ncbi:MAG TPA: AAA family ATPase [Blastocatellia bacterium]|nr:AAA family ATPase [Blastocatellia bacterium]